MAENGSGVLGAPAGHYEIAAPVAMVQMIRHVIITGGTGYIGRRVATAALARGYTVTVLSRSAAALPRGAVHRAWALGEILPEDSLDVALPAAAQAVIHLAHDGRNPSMTAGNEGGLNVAGTRKLLDSSRQHGIGRFVFVSSQSARADAANIYGRVKWSIEQALDRPGEVAARVGLVYGGPPHAMFGLLCKLTARAPILPMIDPWREVQPIHIDEVVEGLLRIVECGGTGWVGLAAPQSLPFGRFLQILAREFHGKSLPILPVPLSLALLACEATARIRLLPMVDCERVLGLAETRVMDCADQLRALGLTIVPLEAGLRRERNSRKAILAEGHALLRYVLGAPPGPTLLRRYARSVAAAGDGALPLSRLFRGAPTLLRLADPLANRTPLSYRLRLASTLAETSPQGERMLAAGSRGSRLAALAAQLALDGLALPVRLLWRG
jgi:nucleoside-diphosphate-sugar epimerase